jgi:hypothetical protein
MRAAPDEGLALPSPFQQFGQYGIKLRRGQVSLWASASGCGKSALATHVAVHATPKIPTLYCSADTDKVTLGTRVAAGILRQPLSRVEPLLRAGDPETWEVVATGSSHIWWYWDASPSLQDIQDELEAYAYTTGDWPHLVVVDNLINVDSEGEAGHAQKDGVLHWLQQLGNLTNAHIMVLHHVTGQYEDGSTPVPKSGLLDKVAKRPRLVCTLYRASENLLGVRVVKNSSGKMDANGGWGPDIAVMFERAWMQG